MPRMNAAEIIDALGGSGEVAEYLGTSLSVVSNMKQRGIPASRRLEIHEMAVLKGKAKEITPDMIRAAGGRQAAA